MSNLVAPTKPTVELARTLGAVMRACNTESPLQGDDPRFLDLAEGRGDHATERLIRRLRKTERGELLHAAFVGHRGAGKTTEIQRVLRDVADLYLPVYIEATLEMDSIRIEVEDLLLNIAIAVEAEMRRIGKELPQELLERVEGWFAEKVRTTRWAHGLGADVVTGAEGKLAAPFVASLFAQARTLLKYESEYRTEVKQVLKQYPGTLLQSVNDILDAAHERLDGRSLLVVIDNLDRYEPTVIDELLVATSDRIRRLRCCLLLTPPVSLLLQPKSARLDDRYACFDLFTVRLRKPEQRYDEFDAGAPGRDLLEQALGKRIDVGVMIPEKEARDRLIAASGGAIRELLELTSLSAEFARGDVILEADVEKALAYKKQRMRDQINVNDWWPALRDIAETKQVTADPRSLNLLFYRFVFKYNGEGWYDIHPLIAELKELRR
ncbi:hypothetical protein [Polyangium spumosum]|uniref:AAA family ATPase n=1 Tax=Polyangium spumosum TaxID=889282 RepID=A0A6N7PKK6_9BACT|nr:hypothetical protein [Polyangium spumosum]MRG90655.1 hypothetical protein [Polyangium spumosum]